MRNTTNAPNTLRVLTRTSPPTRAACDARARDRLHDRCPVRSLRLAAVASAAYMLVCATDAAGQDMTAIAASIEERGFVPSWVTRFRAQRIHVDTDTIWFTTQDVCPTDGFAYVRRTGDLVRGTYRRCWDLHPPQGGLIPPDRALGQRGRAERIYAADLTIGARLSRAQPRRGPAPPWRLHLDGIADTIPLRVNELDEAALLSQLPDVGWTGVSLDVSSWRAEDGALFFGLAGSFQADIEEGCEVGCIYLETGEGRAGGVLRFDRAERSVTAILAPRLANARVMQLAVSGGWLWVVAEGGSTNPSEADEVWLDRYRFATGEWERVAGNFQQAAFAADSVWLLGRWGIDAIDARTGARVARFFYRDSVGLDASGGDTVFTTLSSEPPDTSQAARFYTCPRLVDGPDRLLARIGCDLRVPHWRELRTTLEETFADSIIALIDDVWMEPPAFMSPPMFGWTTTAPRNRPNAADRLGRWLADDRFLPVLIDALRYGTDDGLAIATRAFRALGGTPHREGFRAALGTTASPRTIRIATTLLVNDDSTAARWLARRLGDEVQEYRARDFPLTPHLDDLVSLARRFRDSTAAATLGAAPRSAAERVESSDPWVALAAVEREAQVEAARFLVSLPTRWIARPQWSRAIADPTVATLVRPVVTRVLTLPDDSVRARTGGTGDDVTELRRWALSFAQRHASPILAPAVIASLEIPSPQDEGSLFREEQSVLVYMTGLADAPRYGESTQEARRDAAAFWRQWLAERGGGFVVVSPEEGQRAVTRWRQPER